MHVNQCPCQRPLCHQRQRQRPELRSFNNKCVSLNQSLSSILLSEKLSHFFSYPNEASNGAHWKKKKGSNKSKKIEGRRESKIWLLCLFETKITLSMHAPNFWSWYPLPLRISYGRDYILLNHDDSHSVRSAQYTTLLRVIFYSLSNVWINWWLMPSGDATTPLLELMQKNKTRFKIGKQRI